MSTYEWDKNKCERNIKKHGIDFIDALEVFNDINRVETESYQNHEKRYKTMGKMKGIVILLVYTIRQNHIRIISARKASRYERKIYETSNKK